LTNFLFVVKIHLLIWYTILAFQSIWYFSDLPNKIVETIEEDLSKFDRELGDSRLMGDCLNKDKRNSKNAWIPTTHWTAGFIWHYIERANRENFLYDIRNIDGESMQYTQYGEGEFYGWHNDAGLSSQYKPVSVGNHHEGRANDFVNENLELVRKLSFTVQLSDSDEYEGGNVQFLDESNNSYFAPRKKGSVVIFDSRTQHRVLKVTKGVRKSLVGWVVGPRWK
jgi:PKHD-type hydroxylase